MNTTTENDLLAVDKTAFDIAIMKAMVLSVQNLARQVEQLTKRVERLEGNDDGKDISQ
jgi:hypothetical protein